MMIFKEYKESNYLIPEDVPKNIFVSELYASCSETDFLSWVSSRCHFLGENLNTLSLSWDAWEGFVTEYKSQSITKFIDVTYPKTGWFEGVSTDKRYRFALVAGVRNPGYYRVSIIEKDAPFNDIEFPSRSDALEYLAVEGYHNCCVGAYDNLADGDAWDRGVLIRYWCMNSVHPLDAIKQNKERSDVKRLFPEYL